MEVTFLHPEYLILLISIPLLIISHFLSLKFLKGKALKLSNYPAIERITGKKIRSKNYTILMLRCVTIFFLVLSAAGAIVWYETISSGSDYVLAIDASGSMLAEDFSPSRLEAAKNAAIEFIKTIDENSNNAKIGIVTFAGTSVINSYLTYNTNELIDTIRKIDVLPTQGTDISEAIITSVNVLKSSEKAKKIILITDGQSNVGMTVKDGITYANKELVTINTIGIGTEEGGSIEGLETKMRINQDELIEIARKTGGNYSLATNSSSLVEIYKSMIFEQKEKKPINLQLPLLMVSIMFIFIEWGLISTRYRVLP